MSSVFPALEKYGLEVHYGLAKGARFNDPAAFRRAHPYIVHAHIMDGSVGTPNSRSAAVEKLIRKIDADLVIPVAIGDALTAVRRSRISGVRSKLLVPLHSMHVGLLADVYANADLIDCVSCVSGLQYKWCSNLFKDTNVPMLRWIRNGVRAPEVRRPDGLSAKLRLGFVGRLEQLTKRVLDLPPLLDWLRTLEVPVEFTVAGDGPDRERLSDMLASLGDYHDIRMLGHLDTETIYRDVYPSIDCLLLFSPTEGAPVVISEAISHGVVPIISRYLGLASDALLKEGETCVSFDIGDAEAAARAVRRLSSDRLELARLSAACLRESTQVTQLGMIDRWRDVCLEVIARDTRDVSKLVPSAQGRAMYGRLDRFGLPAGVSEVIRSIWRKPYQHASGFDEWPGSLNTDPELQAGIGVSLRELESDSMRKWIVEND